jgi:phosphoenolpyruvate carboxylase
MKTYAELDSNKNSRSKLLNMILTDYEDGMVHIEDILGGSASIRRTGQFENMKWREKELNVLHELHIKYLKEWRAIKDTDAVEADKILTKLLSIINSLSGGLKNTG